MLSQVAVSDQNQAQLLSAAQAGDRQAIEQLVLRIQPQVLRFGLKMCRNREDAQDVMQETLLAAARGLPQFRGSASFSTWLYTIARSYCIKKNRKSRFAPKQHSSLDDEEAFELRDLAAPGQDPEEAALGRELESAISGAIAELDPMYREVLVLRDIQGLTAPEVAEIVNAKVGAVKSRLHRARSSVRRRLEPLLERGEKPEISAEDGLCPNILETFSARLDGEIDAKLCEVMQAHLELCPRCQQQCDSLNRVLRACRNSPEPDVPEALQEAVRRGMRQLWELELKGEDAKGET